MSIPKALEPQRDFSAGELDPDAIRRDDTDIHKAGLKTATNTRPLDVKGLTRRPGRRIRYYDMGLNAEIAPASDKIFYITFSAMRFVARTTSGLVNTEITTAPWTDSMLPDLQWELVDKQIFVTHRSMKTQVITYDPDEDDWTLADFEFLTGLSGEVRAPFHRFADFGVTMQPSALTGSITIAFSENVLDPDHVGVIFRYAERQLQITAVTDEQNANADVIQDLPETQRLTMASTTGFSVGELVEGDTTNARGEIIAINAGVSIDVVLIANISGFTTSDTAVGPNAKHAVTGVSTITPGASVQWDEQFISDFRGYPGSVAKDRNRLILSDFEQLEEAIAWSALDSPTDFKITGAADGAILETVPDTGRVYGVVGGADQFVFTSKRIYYIPISGSTPLVPGSIEFRRIASEGAARVPPIPVSDGAVYISQSRKRIMAIQATGQQTRPWLVQPISRFHGHLVSGPTRLAAVAGAGDVPGEALYCINSDGSLIVARYDEGDEWVGWFPWTGTGRVTDIRSSNNTLLLTCAYDLGSTIETVESPDDTLVMDGVIELSDPADDGLVPFVGETLDVMTTGGFYLGQYVVGGGGTLTIDGWTDDDLIAGVKYTVTVEPFLESFEGGEAFGQRTRRQKVGNVIVRYRDSHQFYSDGRVGAANKAGQNIEGTRETKSGVLQYRQKGRSWDPTVTISQPEPGRFKLVELTAEVSI